MKTGDKINKEMLGETTDYEKKEFLEVKKPKSWCKSISAFANGDGGRLYFGIADDGSITGLSDASLAAEQISEGIKVHLNPIPDVHLSIENIDNHQIVIVKVASGDETPYYYEGDGQLIAYIRIGNESVPANPSKLRELVLKGSGRSFDSLISGYQFSDMAFTKMKSVYRQRTGNAFEDNDYVSWGIIDSNNHLTNAGALLADESPIRQSRLFCTRWNGVDKSSGIIDAIDDQEYSGGLVSLLQNGMNFVMRNSRKSWMKAGEGRIEFPDYPERAVQEEIVNALIHRNYLDVGSEVHVDMFDNRLEIYSPGGMVDDVMLTDDNIRYIPSKRRNPVIADIFNRLLLMERRGSGFGKILDAYRFQKNYRNEMKPEFRNVHNSFILTLWNLNYEKKYSRNGNYDSGHDEIEDKIRVAISTDNRVSKKQLSDMLDISVRTIERRMAEMTDIQYIGSGDHGYWKIDDSDNKNGGHDGGHDGGHNGGHDEIEDKIRAAISTDNKVSKKQLSAMLGISVRTIERRMAGMTDIQYIGSGNHGYWKIDDSDSKNGGHGGGHYGGHDEIEDKSGIKY